MQKPALISRIDGLDVARGLALVAMASYHFIWDLELFGYVEPGTATGGFLKYYARAIASSFLFILGFSLVLATLNGIKWKPFLLRLLQVGAAALAISIATYFAVPKNWIFFGILHHIVLASIVGLLFIRLHFLLVLGAAAIAFALPHLGVITTETQWLSFIGIFANPPNSNDFVPILPWISASLAGMAAAKIALAYNWLEKLSAPKATKTPARQLRFLGKHSLVFYIIHQPVLIGLVWLVSQIISPNQYASAFQTSCKTVCSQQFTENSCTVYCNCFESELTDNAAQWSQLPVESQSKAISEICTTVMQETVTP